MGLCLVVAATYANTVIPSLLGRAIDEIKAAIAQPSLLDKVGKTCLLIVFCAVGAFVLRNSWRFLIMGFTRSAEFHIRQKLFTRLQELSPDFYVKNNTGDLITRAIQDTQGVRMMLGMGLVGIVDVLTVNLVTVASMVATASWRLTLMAVIPLPLLLYLITRLRRIMRKKFSAVQASVSDISGKVQENITGIRVIKAFAQEKSENEQFATLSKKKWAAEMDMTKYSAAISPVSALIFGLVFSIFLYFGGKMVVDGTLTLGEFVTFNTYIAYLMEPIQRLSRIIMIWQRGVVSMQRMDLIFTAKPTVTDEHADPSITSIVPISVSVNGLQYTYPGMDKPVLSNVSFDLPQGGILAVMGATGSGKSTLLSLLMRMWDPPAGTVEISGHGLDEIPLATLRGGIAYVPQETFLFSDTVMNNIRFYAESVTPEDAIEAAKAAAVHDNILELTKQYDTVVGERGMTLSGGQKQRISIARALARHPGLLLLDDCLSAVDAETEQKILANLREYLQNCTTIIVTHRIAVAGLADRVLLLDEDGNMEALGTHSELQATNPAYRHLLEILEEGGREAVRHG